MFSQLPNRRMRLGPTSLSVAAHAVAAVALFFSLRMHPVKVFSLPGTDLGTRVELTYLPGRAPAPAAHPQTKVNPKAVSRPSPTFLAAAPSAVHLPPLPHLTVTEAAPSPNISSPASATPDSNSGSDSWGSGSIQIALTTYSPSPAPDLSVLPHGVQGDVVVDVTIDPSWQGRRSCCSAHPWLRHRIQRDRYPENLDFSARHQGRHAYRQRAGAALSLWPGLDFSGV